MRQVLVDAARARLTGKRGSGSLPLPLEESHAISADQVSDNLMIRIADALKEPAELNPQLAQVVECRLFAGYSAEETAEALAITSRTVERDRVKARSWLYRELNPD